MQLVVLVQLWGGLRGATQKSKIHLKDDRLKEMFLYRN